MSPTPAQVRVAKVGALATVLVAVIGVAGTWLANQKMETKIDPPTPSHLTVAVFDEDTKVGIEDAETTLTVAGKTQDGRTDSTGRHIFELDSDVVRKVGVVRVAKSGYQSRRIELAITAGGDSREIYLSRVPAQVARLEPTSTTPPAPDVGPRTDKKLHPAVVTSTHTPPTTTGSSSDATLVRSTIAPSAVAQPAYDTITETFRSGPRGSGLGKSFSDWYTLCTPTLPEGAEILNVAYRLEGDRQCGAWSECRLGESTPTRACFEFRLQGHDEVIPWRPFESEGFLTVTYKKPKAPA